MTTSLGVSFGSILYIHDRDQVFNDNLKHVEKTKKDIENCLDELKKSEKNLWLEIREDVMFFLTSGEQAKTSLSREHDNLRDNLRLVRAAKTISKNSAESFCLNEIQGLEQNFRKLLNVLNAWDSRQYSVEDIRDFCRAGKKNYDLLNEKLTDTNLIRTTLNNKKEEILKNLAALPNQVSENSETALVQHRESSDNILHSNHSAISTRANSPLEKDVSLFT